MTKSPASPATADAQSIRLSTTRKNNSLQGSDTCSRRKMSTSEFLLICKGSDSSVHPPPMRHENNARNIPEQSTTRNDRTKWPTPATVGAKNNNQDSESTRNGGATKNDYVSEVTRNSGTKKKFKSWKSPARMGQSTKLNSNTRKLWRFFANQEKELKMELLRLFKWRETMSDSNQNFWKTLQNSHTKTCRNQEENQLNKSKGGSQIFLEFWENVAGATIGDYLVNPRSLN